jgi:hypothetical protein
MYNYNLLNYDSIIQPFGQLKDWDKVHYFIRPCKDSKIFTGRVFNQDEWNEFVRVTLTNGHDNNIDQSTKIQAASVKTIYKEIRCWVVGGKVITAAQYTGINLDDGHVEAKEFAQKMVDLHQIAEAFVIDVCLCPAGWKVVELNCINCSGFYGANVDKLLEAIDTHFTNQINNG